MVQALIDVACLVLILFLISIGLATLEVVIKQAFLGILTIISVFTKRKSDSKEQEEEEN